MVDDKISLKKDWDDMNIYSKAIVQRVESIRWVERDVQKKTLIDRIYNDLTNLNLILDSTELRSISPTLNS